MAKILIAGGDQAAMDVLSAEIIAEGHTVLTERDGHAAYETSVAEGPDLIFLEAQMPVFNGCETCALIRNDPTFPPRLPVFILTRDDYEPAALRKCGATGRFLKEHVSQDLRDLLVEYLGASAVPDA